MTNFYIPVPPFELFTFKLIIYSSEKKETHIGRQKRNWPVQNDIFSLPVKACAHDFGRPEFQTAANIKLYFLSSCGSQSHDRYLFWTHWFSSWKSIFCLRIFSSQCQTFKSFKKDNILVLPLGLQRWWWASI